MVWYETALEINSTMCIAGALVLWFWAMYEIVSFTLWKMKKAEEVNSMANEINLLIKAKEKKVKYSFGKIEGG